ncbi:hypothetical protein [Cedecea davisae]|uniref:hypothetical protein n=1 Tax=Cedecea davisae TaxID=158484 RepID=UPI001D0A5C8B|nr:hypothetical protein [Cedecea davisae]
MKEKNNESILRFLIRNYAINSTSSFDELFDINAIKPKKLKQSHNEFRCNYQFYVNRYLALSYIYQSFANIGSSYSTMALLEERKIFNLNKRKEADKFYITINEPFMHQVVMQYAKLYEALVNIDALNSENNLFNEKERKHAVKLLSGPTLKTKYLYLNELRKRIESSGVLDLRNSIFAHPFKDENAGSVVFLEDVTSKMFKIFKDLCDDEDKNRYDKASNRIRFFCNNYIMRAEYDATGVFKQEFRIITKAKTHVKAIYDFMSAIRDEKLLGEEPILIVDASMAKSELESTLSEV